MPFRYVQCNGARPVCNTCANKASACRYDMDEDQRWQAGLRSSVKRLETELQQVKSILPDLAIASDREAAHRIALEVQESGFSEHSAEELQQELRGDGREQHAGSGGDDKPAASLTIAAPDTALGQSSSSLSPWPPYPGLEGELPDGCQSPHEVCKS